MAASSTVALREGDHQAMSLSAKVNRIIRDYGRDRNEAFREDFVNAIWSELMPDYGRMASAVQRFCEMELQKLGVKCKITNRAKSQQSVKKSLERREGHLRDTQREGYTGVKALFDDMHDLAGIRIILTFPDDMGKAHSFVTQTFQEFSPPNIFRADRTVGWNWKPWFGAYQCHNHHVTIQSGRFDELSEFCGVLFEIQVTTCAEDSYNMLAHPLLYKEHSGRLSRQDEIVIDMSHATALLHSLALMYFKGKLQDSSGLQRDKLSRELEEAMQIDPPKSEDFGLPLGEVIPAQELIEVLDAPPEDCTSVPVLRRWLNGKLNKSHLEAGKDYQCLRDLRITDPSDDKTRILSVKGGLIEGASQWATKSSEFRQWQNDTASRLLWVRGDPGKGKTMLLCSIIEDLEKKSAEVSGPSPAYFFCQAGNSQLNNAVAVLRGLIYLLITQQPSLISYLENKHKTAGKSLFEDMNAWFALSKIFTAMLSDTRSKNGILVIDGLDECGEPDLKRLLDLISSSVSSCQGKWIVSSRNWPAIQQALEKVQPITLQLEGHHDFVTGAVEMFINSRVSQLPFTEEIREEVQYHLIQNCEGTFLWAALVCEELKSTDEWDAIDVVKEMPQGLDELYERMLRLIQGLRRNNPEWCRKILSTVTLAYQPLHLEELMTLLGPLPRQTATMSTASVRRIAEMCGSFLTLKDDIVYLIHQSAKDFLLTKAVDKILPEGIKAKHRDIFSESLAGMNRILRRDIYDLGFPGYSIQDVMQPNPDPLTPIRYSCVFWIDHVHDSIAGDSELDHAQITSWNDDLPDASPIHGFLQKNILFWLEALSLLRSLSKGVVAIDILAQILRDPIAQDLRRFVHSHKGGIGIAPLQVYASALVFSPVNSQIRRLHRREEPEWITLKPLMESEWDAYIQSFEGAANREEVDTLVFSPNGQWLAATAYGSIRVWNTVKGTAHEFLKPFESEEGLTPAFSPDSQQLAGISDDKITIWDVLSGTSLSSCMISKTIAVAFSEDGQKLVSGSSEGEINIWEVATGQCLKTSEVFGHATRAALSPNGQNLALYTPFDSAIKVWDAFEGRCVHILECFETPIQAVAFSPDSQQLVSALRTEVQIWDVSKGTCLQVLTVSELNSRSLHPVALSPDNQRLACASEEGSLEIWDATAQGKRLQTFERRFEDVCVVSFSPNGQQVATGTDIGGIRIWDAIPRFPPHIALDTSMSPRGYLEGKQGEEVKATVYHNGEVHSVLFSPDGQVVVSRGYDLMINIWDATTDGTCRQKLVGAKAEVGYFASLNNMVFSPNGQQLAASFHSGVVKVWDTADWSVLKTLKGPHPGGDSIVYSPDSQMLAASFWQGVVMVWTTTDNWTTLQAIKDFEVLYEVELLGFSPDSQRLATAQNYTVKVWDATEDWALVQTVRNSGQIHLWRQQLASVWTNSGHELTFEDDDTTSDPGGWDLPYASGRFQLCDENAWVAVDGRRMLWIPPQYRPRSCVDSTGLTIAFGCLSGRVVVMRFSEAIPG